MTGVLMENRNSTRVSFEQDVIVNYKDNSWHAKSKDISIGGMFIMSRSFPKVGAEITLVLNIGKLERVQVPAFVRWVNNSGFGVQFGLIGAKLTHEINSLHS